MDKYVIIDSLKEGPQGAAFLVRHRVNNTTYVLKKIECNDDPEAHKALREVKRLAKLRHRHVSVPHDVFLHWGAKEAAIYLCVVSKFFVTGDLDTFINEKSRKSSPIKEIDLRRWYGQILHALVYLYDNGIAHTNLKPSNIYLTPEMDVCIGDIGIRAIVEDLYRFRSRTRSVVWTLYWMPPEVFDGPHGTTTDVWALGCFLYEVAVMRHQSILKSRDLMLSMRLGEKEDFLQSLDQLKCDNADIISACVRQLLCPDQAHRPTIRDAIKLPYPQLCLDLVTTKASR
ncbi:serine/threonine kinase-like domain-containing protein STKLD1 [Diadema antillarum]|uniref:serine/threonine kinase-like domain-containing protein STKLD1 n=1 Tax=Diadema antillarum TaxID=105358 RepID=UPI003A8A889B